MVKGLPVLFYFLLLLVFILAVKYIMRGKWWSEGRRPENSLILVVSNRQETIEGIIRRATQIRNGYATNMELVVIDNGSRDETPGIIDRLARSPGGFNFINATGGKGVKQIIEMGLEISRGEKICYLGFKEKMFFNDIYNVLNDVMVRNPSGHFLPRHYFVELKQQDRTLVPGENKTWGN